MNGILLNQGGAGAVESVNGQIGEVTLSAVDINSYTIEEINELLNNKAENIQEITETKLDDLRLNNNNPVLFKITGTEDTSVDPSFSPYFVYTLEEQPSVSGSTTNLFQYKILQDGIYFRKGTRSPAAPGLSVGNVWEDWENINKISSINGKTGEVTLTTEDLYDKFIVDEFKISYETNSGDSFLIDSTEGLHYNSTNNTFPSVSIQGEGFKVTSNSINSYVDITLTQQVEGNFGETEIVTHKLSEKIEEKDLK